MSKGRSLGAGTKPTRSVARKASARADQATRADSRAGGGSAVASGAEAGTTSEHRELEAKPQHGDLEAEKPDLGAAPAVRVSGLDLAAQALADSGEPMSAKAIAERVIAAGWRTEGRTPHATLYAAIVREIARKGAEARFVRGERGRFAARRTS